MSQSPYTVAVYLNVDRNNFDGYQPHHPLATANDLVFRVNAISHEDAAEKAWPVGNKVATDLDNRSWPRDVRSFSVGDVAKVTGNGQTRFYACARGGWDEIAEPTNPVVALAGTRATSRK
ncbi:hypothetical protein GCM10023196_037160 [Actinoallomurus vinaceus]|uniref:Uncharacterized protein n=1 Tax=Actinoallomurus vinaceus TaxID=1080074 RepID=A0ABP8UD20_9ACTN